MRSSTLPRLASLLALLITCGGAAAQQDRQAQQQQRRQQLQMQQLQQQLQEAQAAKAKLEAENAELKKSAESRERQAGAAVATQRQLDQKLKAAEAERSTLAGSAADLERRLADAQKRAAEALAAKDRELAELGRTLKTGELRETDLQGRFREQVRLVSECSEKNERLVQVGAELLGRYRDKGLGDVLRNREPVLGFADVATFNLLQDLRDRLDGARFTPTAPR
jgi:chromosome segregation ATPase